MISVRARFLYRGQGNKAYLGYRNNDENVCDVGDENLWLGMSNGNANHGVGQLEMFEIVTIKVDESRKINAKRTQTEDSINTGGYLLKSKLDLDMAISP